MRTPDPWVPPQVPTSTRSLRASGLSDRKIAAELERGTIVRLRRGVVVAAGVVGDDTRQLHLLRALAEQRVNPALVASHETAALEWALPLRDEAGAAADLPSLLLPRRGTNRSEITSSARIRLADLPDEHVTLGTLGLSVTTRARTAADLVTDDLPASLVVLDAALRAECLLMPGVRRRRDLTNLRVADTARSLIADAAVSPATAATLARTLPLADPRRETPIESLSAGHIHQAGLPAPIPQAPIRTTHGVVYPDFLWSEHHVIGEADGAGKYDSQDVMLREKAREQVLRDMGFAIVRWTGKEIHLTPRHVIGRISRALDQASWVASHA